MRRKYYHLAVAFREVTAAKRHPHGVFNRMRYTTRGSISAASVGNWTLLSNNQTPRPRLRPSQTGRFLPLLMYTDEIASPRSGSAGNRLCSPRLTLNVNKAQTGWNLTPFTACAECLIRTEARPTPRLGSLAGRRVTYQTRLPMYASLPYLPLSKGISPTNTLANDVTPRISTISPWPKYNHRGGEVEKRMDVCIIFIDRCPPSRFPRAAGQLRPRLPFSCPTLEAQPSRLPWH